MRLGLTVSSFSWPEGAARIGARLAEIGRAAEAAGFASLWVMDHFFQIDQFGRADEPMLEGYSALNFLAAATEKIRLGTLVTGVIYRYPGILVKTATTLDVLSGGRSYFGIGAGWFEREAVALGVPFPPMKERFERLEETIQIALQMWSDDAGSFAGKHYRLAETLNSPQSISRPHPPILIGGAGEKRTLPLVAKYADACNLYAVEGAEVLRSKLDALRRCCDAIGRSFDDIERTAIGSIDLRAGAAAVPAAIEFCRGVRKAGIEHLIVSIPADYEIAPIELIGKEIIPRLADLSGD